MKIYPDTKVQTLEECVPGQFVRSLERGDRDRIGIVFDAQDQEKHLRGIVTLVADVPAFEVEQRPDQITVLAFSGNVIWEIDHQWQPEAGAHDLGDKTGVIICAKDGWFLNVAWSPASETRIAEKQLNLSSGYLDKYRSRGSKVAMFGAWVVSLEEDGRPFEVRSTMAKFNFNRET